VACDGPCRPDAWASRLSTVGRKHAALRERERHAAPPSTSAFEVDVTASLIFAAGSFAAPAEAHAERGIEPRP